MNTHQAMEPLKHSLNAAVTYCKMISTDVQTGSAAMASWHLLLLQGELKTAIEYAEMVANERHLLL